jgi:hypothetical protein
MSVVEDLSPPDPPHQTKVHGHPEVTPTSRALGFITDEMLDYVDALMDGTTNMATLDDHLRALRGPCGRGGSVLEVSGGARLMMPIGIWALGVLWGMPFLRTP